MSNLDTAGLLAGIEKYSADTLRQRSSSPKFLVHNTALISSQKTEYFKYIQSKHELWGRVVESSVGAHLLNHSLTDGFGLFYWRHRNDEIDFVLRKGSKIIGLEVKSGASQKASGMPWQEFLELNPSELF